MKACAMNASRLLSGFALAIFASAAVASPPACLPKVEKAWIRAAPPGATMLAGYALVRNDCKAPLVLTGAKSRDFVMAQVHESRVENGTSRMEHAKRTTLAVGATFVLAPGKHHLMLMHPRRRLPEGTVVVVDLLLADGRKVPAEFTVRKSAPE
jgi:copper(I)-binding protein